MRYGNRRVVVTGIGAVTPIGLTANDFWEGMLSGVSGSAPITHFDAEGYDSRFACELKGFDPLNYIDRKLARRMDPFSHFAMAATAECVKDAGIDSSSLGDGERERIGVVFGSGIGGMQVFHQQTEIFIKNGVHRLSPFFIPMLIPDIASGHISIQYGFRGPNYCVVSACATGNNNIGDACMLIQNGYADSVLTGGTEASISELGVGGFNALKALSTRNEEPETASRPFDATRDGFVLGEGAGALFVEELEHAKKRGAKIYAEIVGLGFSADAYHITAPDPEGNGAAYSMKTVVQDAEIEPADVDYLNMHGTSTPLGDIAETVAIKKVFGDHAYDMNLSSTKSMTGHLLGAAGAVEAIATILAVKNDIVPPTINFATPDPSCDLNYTFNEAQRRTVNVGITNAFGFGGHNTSVAFRKYDE